MGVAAGELALGGVTEGVKRLAGKTPETAVNAFLTATNAQKLARRLAGMRGALRDGGAVALAAVGNLLGLLELDTISGGLINE